MPPGFHACPVQILPIGGRGAIDAHIRPTGFHFDVRICGHPALKGGHCPAARADHDVRALGHGAAGALVVGVGFFNQVAHAGVIVARAVFRNAGGSKGVVRFGERVVDQNFFLRCKGVIALWDSPIAVQKWIFKCGAAAVVFLSFGLDLPLGLSLAAVLGFFPFQTHNFELERALTGFVFLTLTALLHDGRDTGEVSHNALDGSITVCRCAASREAGTPAATRTGAVLVVGIAVVLRRLQHVLLLAARLADGIALEARNVVEQLLAVALRLRRKNEKQTHHSKY